MRVPSNPLPFIRFRRIAALVVTVPLSLIAILTIITVQGSFDIAAIIAAAGFIVSFIIDGRLLYADLAQRSRVRQLLIVQAISTMIASAIIIHVWSGVVTLVCLSGCSEARIAQVNAEALGFAVILGVMAGLIFLAPSVSVWRRVHR